MPTLTYTIENTPHGGTFHSRVLIGRKLSHGVVLDNPEISRVHAWIDPESDDHSAWILTDSGGKVGTFVNNQRITRKPLEDGDVIRVADVEIVYHDQEEVDLDVRVAELTSPTGTVETAGILFNCHCGAPLWVGNDLAGKRGMCRHCHTPVTVPQIAPKVEIAPPPVTPAVKPAANQRGMKCGVCHAAITPEEQSTQCPDCAVRFHAECWQENLGCSSYGCPQVNALKPAPRIDLSAFEPSEEVASVLPWGLILLAASVVASVLGALLFGGLAAIVAVVSMIMLIRSKYKRRELMIGAIILSIIGVAAGLAISDFWYFQGQHLSSLGVHAK